MGSMGAGALSLLQTAAAGGLVASGLVAALCAALWVGASGEQAKRELAAVRVEEAGRVALIAEEGTDEAREAARVARADAVGASARARSLEAEVASLRAALNASRAAPPPPDEETTERLAELTEDPRRSLTGAQGRAMSNALDGREGLSVEVTSAPGEEARLYAVQLADALRGAGLAVTGPYGVLTTSDAEGLYVSIGEPGGGGEAVLAALQSASLDARPSPSGDELAALLVPDDAEVRVYVAPRPREDAAG